MKVNIFSGRKKKESIQNTSKFSKRRIFSSVRFRILAWYFLLTTCTVLVSVVVTHHIFCNILKSRTQEVLVAEVSKFDRLVEQQLVSNQSAQPEDIIKKVLSLHFPARDKYILAMIEGQIFHDHQLPLPEAIIQNSTLLEEWAKVSA